MNSPIEISNGRETVKIYQGTSRGRPYFQLAFYQAGRRERRTFSDNKEAQREALFKKFSAENCDFPSGAKVVKWLDEKYENTVTKNSHMKTLKALVAWAVRERLVVTILPSRNCGRIVPERSKSTRRRNFAAF